MSTGKYISLEEARKNGQLDRFIKEHPSKADGRLFRQLLDAMTTKQPAKSETSTPDRPVVVTELKLLEVFIQVLTRNMNMRSPDRQLQAGPEAFNPVNVATLVNILADAVINRLMAVADPVQPVVRAEFIGMDNRALLYVLINVLQKGGDNL